jgi:hypothetical protein
MRDKGQFFYQSGGFTIAIDAVSQRDAANYLRCWFPGRKFDFQGQHEQGHEYTTACCGTTEARQAQIHEEFEHWMRST